MHLYSKADKHTHFVIQLERLIRIQPKFKSNNLQVKATFLYILSQIATDPPQMVVFLVLFFMTLIIRVLRALCANALKCGNVKGVKNFAARAKLTGLYFEGCGAEMSRHTKVWKSFKGALLGSLSTF